MSEWRDVTVDDFTNLTAGKNAPKALRSQDGEFRMLGANGAIGRTTEAIHQGPFVTVGRVGACGSVHRVGTERVWVSDNALIATPVEGRATVDFLALALESLDYGAIMYGSSQPLVTQTAIRSLPFSLPSLAEQRRIVDVMSAVDAQIETLRERAEAGRMMRLSLLLDLLDGAEGEDFALADLADVKKGKKPIDLSPTPAPGSTEYLTADYLRRQKPARHCPQSSVTMASAADFLVLWDGAGAGDIFAGEPGAVASTMARVRVTRPGVSPGYLRLAVESQQHGIKASLRGTTVPHVDGSHLKSLTIPVPAHDEQQRIVGIISAVDDDLAAAQSKLDASITMRAALLDDLLGQRTAIPESYDAALEAVA